MISAAPFYCLAKQKNIQIFAISMQNIEYQLNKAEKSSTDPVTVVLKYYHNFLNVFLKEVLNKVLISFQI